jgi:hypothetical protein
MLAGGLFSLVISSGVLAQIEIPPARIEVVPPTPSKYCLYRVTQLYAPDAPCLALGLSQGITACTQCDNNPTPPPPCKTLTGIQGIRVTVEKSTCEIGIRSIGSTGNCEDCPAKDSKTIRIVF